MNKEILKGNWNEIKGKLKKQWGDLTDDDISKINGNYDMLVGRLQKAYGYRKERVQKDIDDFLKKNKYTEEELP